MQDFDPSGIAIQNGNFFGLPYQPDDAQIVLLSCPWDVTTSYRDGTWQGPKAMLEASYQLDLSSPYKKNAWNTRISSLPMNPEWEERNHQLRLTAKEIISLLEKGISEDDPQVREMLEVINKAGKTFHGEVEAAAATWLAQGKRVITVGGDHSISYGPILAHTKTHPSFSVLHFDAHADLRDAYEGFEHSHASIMRHVEQMPAVNSLVQVGIRDVSPDEISYIENSKKLKTFYDWNIRRKTAQGVSWHDQCLEMIAPLEKKVYLSIDIDGLDPKYCPNTGTPVPGGIELWEMLYLIEQIKASGREIIGADLVEVSPGNGESEWDANVGARILYQLCQFLG